MFSNAHLTNRQSRIQKLALLVKLHGDKYNEERIIWGHVEVLPQKKGAITSRKRVFHTPPLVPKYFDPRLMGF
jgi:hypothetical protein